MINYVDNIEFQKNNFPEIFSSYMCSGNTKRKQFFQVKKPDYLYFLVSEEHSLITHINECFGADLIFNSQVSAAVISFGYENHIVDFEIDRGIIKVSVNHPCLEISHSIVFSHTVINDFLENSCGFYSFIDKPLKQMTELRIKKFCQDYSFGTHNLSTYEKMLDIIAYNRPTYIFLQKKEHNSRNMYFKDIEHGDVYSLSIIPIINNSLMLKENEIIQKCVNELMRNFFICCKGVLENYLHLGEFNNNFVIIEKYFQFKKKCEQDLNSYLRGAFLWSIKDFKHIRNDHAALHNMISSDSNVLGIDTYMNEKTNELNKILEEI